MKAAALGMLLILGATSFMQAVLVAPASATIGCGSNISTSTVLTTNLNCGSYYNNALNIVANGVTLNCNGHTITAYADYADVNIENVNQVTVENCVLSGGYYGVYTYSASHVNVILNAFTSLASEGWGVYTDYGDSADTISYNTFYGVYGAIFVGDSSVGITISHNKMAGNYYGILGEYLYASGVTSNSISGCEYGIYEETDGGNTFSGNTVNDCYTAVYIYDYTGGSMYSSNVVKNSYYGFYIYEATANSFVQNKVVSNSYGFYLYYYADTNSFKGNSITSNGYGVYVDSFGSSSNNIFHSNLIRLNGNAVHDYSTGSGTAGTGNYYSDSCSGNSGPSSPAGVC